jgi:hypothetical protein
MSAVDKKRLETWCAALESGQYPQGQGALRPPPKPPLDDAYCCLGVACELFKTELGAEWDSHANLGEALKWLFDGSAGFMPLELGRLIFPRDGWTDPPVELDPVLARKYSCRRTTCSILNDQGESFATIARLLRATYLKPGARP